MGKREDPAIIDVYTTFRCVAVVLGQASVLATVLPPEIMSLVILKSTVEIIHRQYYWKTTKISCVVVTFLWLCYIFCSTAAVENQLLALPI